MRIRELEEARPAARYNPPGIRVQLIFFVFFGRISKVRAYVFADFDFVALFGPEFEKLRQCGLFECCLCVCVFSY